MINNQRILFEEWLKSRPLYQKLVFTQNKPIFNYDVSTGLYDITAVQLAWEAWQEQRQRVAAVVANSKCYSEMQSELKNVKNLPVTHGQLIGIDRALKIKAHLEKLPVAIDGIYVTDGETAHIQSAIDELLALFNKELPF